MNSKMCQLGSFIAELATARPTKGYPKKVRDLCVELAASASVQEIADHSGISKVAIYRWIRDAKSAGRERISESAAESQAPRPLILQEIELPAAQSKPEVSAITIVSANGTTAQLPYNDETVAMVVDRMIGGPRC